MGILDKVKSFIGMGASAAGAASNPVSAVAHAVGGIAGAVESINTKADHAQMLAAGKAEGVADNVAKTEERVAAAGAARGDDRVRNDVRATRYRD